MTTRARELLECAAALLNQGRTVDRLSRPLTVAALVGLLIAPAITEPSSVLIAFATFVALAGLAETYFAIRIGFDAALFHHLAGAPGEPDFSETDAALTRLRVLRSTKAGRPADARAAGAVRLLRFQILALVVQVACVLVSGWIGVTGR